MRPIPDAAAIPAEDHLYQPTWESLRTHPVPQWLRDGKFGIYTHWGIYSVPAVGPNATWYANKVYWEPESAERKHHEQTWGPLDQFGYKDFIPLFRGERFDAEEWADLFHRAGAASPARSPSTTMALPCGTPNTRHGTRPTWGPRRDVVGELAAAIKKRDMKFVAAFHHAENWLFFPTFDQQLRLRRPALQRPLRLHPRNERAPRQSLSRLCGKTRSSKSSTSMTPTWCGSTTGWS